MASHSSLPILRHEIYRAAQSYFQYELKQEEQEACVSKFNALDEDGDRKVSYQELVDKRGMMDSSVADRVCRFYELVDGNANGFLDFDECKALFFLFNKAHFCYGCEKLIIHGGVSCLLCLPYCLNFCCYCAHHHHQQYHPQHYQQRFQALPELINGSLEQNLPPVIAPSPFRQQQQQQQQQHYHHSHGFQSLPPSDRAVAQQQQQQQQQQHYHHSHGFQSLPPSDRAIAPSQAFHQDNARSNNHGFVQSKGTATATATAILGNLATAVVISSCSIM